MVGISRWNDVVVIARRITVIVQPGKQSLSLWRDKSENQQGGPTLLFLAVILTLEE
jgi:hypothetical protein